MRILLRILRFRGGTTRRFVLGAALALAVVAANIALLGLAGWFIAAMAAAGLAGAAINYFTPAAAIRTFAIVRTLGRYLERLVNHDATLRLLSSLRSWVYGRLEPLAPAVLGRFRRGDLLARLVADVDALDAVYLRVLIPGLVAVAGTLGAVLFLSLLAPTVLPVELGLLVFLGLVLPSVMQRLGRADGAVGVETAGALKAELTEGLAGLGELAVFGAVAERRAATSGLGRRLASIQRRGRHRDAVGLAVASAALGLAVWLTFLVAAGRSEPPGGLDPLYLPLLVFFVLASAEIVQGLPATLRALGETVAAGRRVFELADATPLVVDPAQPAALPPRPTLRFEAVRFRHDPGARWALDGLSFELPAGKRLAVVGPSGAGKSSLAQLVLRFRDPDSGRILLAERPLGDYAAAGVRTRIGYVAQATQLFSTTLRQNLLLARPQASDAELHAALERARVADEVAALPDGLDTFVGTGGMHLSAGQARRIALARALLKGAPLLLLDEPTEGLDPINERALIEGLAAAPGPQSLILITHRIAGLEAMDEILVLDRGRLVERGSHDELLARRGLYREMAAYFAA